MTIPIPLLPLGSWFPKSNWPQLPCGQCATGALRLSEPTDIDTAERFKDHPGWDPEWIGGHFSVQAECTNRDCRSIALLAGRMKVDVAVDSRGHWQGDYDMFYELLYCEPALRLVTVPPPTPRNVKQAIDAAAQVIWMSPPSAANRLRAAIEYLLTEIGVPEGRQLNRRIDHLAVSNPTVASALEAVKWIGNDGSHGTAIPLEEVLEGAALLERVLHILFDTTADELDRRAAEINAERRNRNQRPGPPKEPVEPGASQAPVG